jgi:hypothetical protein
MIFPKVQFVARGRSPRATKHRGKNEHSSTDLMFVENGAMTAHRYILECVESHVVRHLLARIFFLWMTTFART